jgi:hypothetical protein
VILSALVSSTILAPGCGPRDFANENDRLRAKVLELEDRIDTLERRNAELNAELRVASAAPGSLPEEVRSSIPHIADIAIGRLSHADDDDGDGMPERVVLYISAEDGRGRFVQMVGELSLNVSILPPDSDAVTIGRIQLAPDELRDAYRSSFAGTHYTVEVPITIPEVVAGARTCDVRVIFDDALTGETHEAHRAIDL